MIIEDYINNDIYKGQSSREIMKKNKDNGNPEANNHYDKSRNNTFIDNYNSNQTGALLIKIYKKQTLRKYLHRTLKKNQSNNALLAMNVSENSDKKNI